MQICGSLTPTRIENDSQKPNFQIVTKFYFSVLDLLIKFFVPQITWAKIVKTEDLSQGNDVDKASRASFS